MIIALNFFSFIFWYVVTIKTYIHGRVIQIWSDDDEVPKFLVLMIKKLTISVL